MSDLVKLVKPLDNAQTDQTVKDVENNSLFHDEAVTADDGLETAVSIGTHKPMDTTMSQEIAKVVVSKKGGVTGFFARVTQRVLNFLTFTGPDKDNHGTGATEADDIRARIALNNANANLDKIDGNGSMVQELNKDLPIKN